VSWPDYLILILSLAVLLGIGAFFTGSQKDTNDFFLGRRQVPWWAACLSFLATEVSALTIVGVPATAYSENWEYLQFLIGSSGAKIVIAFLFVPAFYRHQVTTIYELLGHRFGLATQVTSSIFFFVTRLLGSGVRLYAAALAVGILLEWPLLPTIAIFTVVSIAYIASGGVKAVVWTNVFQAVVFIAAGIAVTAYALSQVDGGASRAFAIAGDAHRLSVIKWGPAVGDPGFGRAILTDPNILWVAVLNGFVGSLAAFGTDHDLMQRLLAVETRGESQRTLLISPFITAVVVLTYLTLGTALYAFYASHPQLAPAKADEVVPQFTFHVVPAALRGFMLTAIVLASIDSPLGSLAASFVTDIYKPLFAPKRDETHYLRVSRASVVVFGLVLAALALYFSAFQGILWLAFKIAGVTFGSLLGVFLLALLGSRRIPDAANVIAMVVMAAVNMVLLYVSETKKLEFAWSWLVIVGTAGTMTIAWILAFVWPGDDASSAKE
jgi:SSS family transporter